MQDFLIDKNGSVPYPVETPGESPQCLSELIASGWALVRMHAHRYLKAHSEN